MIPPLELTRELPVPPDRVWKALTDPQELALWFPDQAEVDVRPGGRGWFVWKDHGRKAVRFELVEPPHRLCWRWSLESNVAVDIGTTTRIEWTLTKRHDGGTTLRLEESGFKTDHHRESNAKGWKRELKELEACLDVSRET